MSRTRRHCIQVLLESCSSLYRYFGCSNWLMVLDDLRQLQCVKCDIARTRVRQNRYEEAGSIWSARKVLGSSSWVRRQSSGHRCPPPWMALDAIRIKRVLWTCNSAPTIFRWTSSRRERQNVSGRELVTRRSEGGTSYRLLSHSEVNIAHIRNAQ